MKKIILFILITFIIIPTIISQNTTVNKGKKYYSFYDYYNAIEKYEPLTDKTPEIKKELAISYFNTGQYTQAEKYYAELCNSDNKNIEDIYDYVKVLLIIEKYDEAESWMNKFAELAPNDTRAKLFASSKGFYHGLSKDRGFFSIKNLDYNNESEEFSPTFYKNRIVYSSSRQEVQIIRRKWAWNKLPFLDIYIAKIDTNNLEFVSYEKFNFNKKFHEGTVAFNKAGDFMMFTSNNYKQKSSDGVIKLEMFSSNLKHGKWSNPKSFPYNNKEYSVGHPTLSPDGKTLYFASDMPGGIGGVDLYVSHLTDGGKWSNPENLGSEINTEGNEMFPFIHPDGFLFFASDGRPGLGGLDVFVAKMQGDKLLSIENLGTPINTNFDDFAFIIDDKLTYGYLSSNRISGKGDDDIYSFKLLVPFFSKKLITGTAVDQDSVLLANVEVSIFDNQSNLLKTIITDQNAYFSFTVEPDQEFTINGTKIKYFGDQKNVSTKTTDPIINTILVLKKIEFSLVGVIKDEKTKLPIDSAQVLLTKVRKALKLDFISDSVGKFKKELLDVNLNDTVNYIVDVKKHGYLPVNNDIQIIFDHPGEYHLEEYMKTNLQPIKVGDDIGKLVDIKPIYFDLDKYNIRPDAAIELDKIVKVMNENPEMVIELGSHTDLRGSDAYNISLSSHRAISSANYIKSKISNPSRIYGKGYGETSPLVVTAEINAQFDFLPVGQILNESFIYSLPTKEQQEAAHQLNRRTEFKIIKF